MGDLMRVPPRESRLARAGKQAAAGGVVLVLVVLAGYFLIHVIEGLVITAAVVVAILAVLYWAFIGRRRS
ncbi:MAG TPA: hypothetical protein VNL35_19810 [Chloroflexota bacterium]|nr:hypothetical protein [Chloroflexota bacterium]